MKVCTAHIRDNKVSVRSMIIITPRPFYLFFLKPHFYATVEKHVDGVSSVEYNARSIPALRSLLEAMNVEPEWAADIVRFAQEVSR